MATGEENTVNYMLARVLSGGSIYRKTELSLFFPRWFKCVKENKPVPSRLPELLTRVLRPWGTPAARENSLEIQAREGLPAEHQWMVELHILMTDEADERFLQHLESLPDRVISFDELYLQAEDDNTDNSSDFLVADPHRTLQFDYEIRDVMTRGDRNEMRKHQDVFYVTGIVSWTVRSPFWNIALATDDAGIRFLSNKTLDRVLPKWRQILTGDKIPTARYGVTDSFRQWLASEKRKAIDLGRPWPETPVNVASSVSKPKSSGPKSTSFISRLRSSAPSRTSPTEFDFNANDIEQTELLREILTEVKDLKLIMKSFLPSSEELMRRDLHSPEMQVHEPWQQPYPAVPQGPSYATMQPFMAQNGRVGSPQFDSTPADQDWQRWDAAYHTPSHVSAPGPGYMRRP
ncbi:hypothetical protein N7457_008198 [Penicillium paradoxum]|uniref:uncharacterized protein n=1 Tax=Penicillium paradoxum TaxID=176176 RepID=UPI00254679D4|nr:uncharacterized protein N7457_008198 [Penicillium paradoxum]KAJ5773302.1 hypothetical protein N7457_008198 [Penicillium paradoxum]